MQSESEFYNISKCVSTTEMETSGIVLISNSWLYNSNGIFTLVAQSVQSVAARL